MVPNRKILVVEDDSVNREMLAEILGDQYAVLQATNGREALDTLHTRGSEIALILLDVMMPVMDGYTFLDRIKQDPALAPIPVIVMTQGNSEEEEASALEHGATDFVSKSCRPSVIRHRVLSLIRLRETAIIVEQFQYDRLTGLYSKEFFYQKVREELAEHPEREYSIVCSNIENFKLYNDTFGTLAGDRLLQDVAGIFRDVVGNNGICGRFSADRFLCLQDKEQERTFRENFIRAKKENGPIMRNVVIRWGIYEITDRSVPVENMCDRALLAVDGIKGQYQQYFAIYDDALRGKLLREKLITDGMENALKENQFTVYFHPKYSLNDGCMVGAEALVRWNHPEWGFLSPGEFIPLFEKNGFISRLDPYIWERVCGQLHDWKERGIPLLPVSVNVSRADIYRLNLEDALPALTRKWGIDPAYLHLEITESVYAEASEQIIHTAEELRRAGFVIEMDDFGKGYSSLNMLSQMKLDILKLDMTFVQSEISKSVSQSILNDVIRMAHRMHLHIVAEGVETREQVKRLQAEGCDYAQGYYFAKPMSAAEFEESWKAQCRHRTVPPQVEVLPDSDIPRLLVADEDPRFREKVRRTFEEDYRIAEAADAENALSCLRENGNGGICAVLLSMTLPGDGASAVLRAMHQDPALWELPVLALLPNGGDTKYLPLALETDDFLCKCHPLFDLRRRVTRLIDLATSHKRETLLREEASRDFLTGLLNRRGFQKEMEDLRTEDLPLAVCLFDLDNLKSINDTCGHETGDRVILAFAELLRRHTRSEDIQCRYGGDEFVVILKHLKHAGDALTKGEEICRLFRDSFPDEPFTACCSGGVALCGADEHPTAKLIDLADQALYLAKRENKGGCCQYHAPRPSVDASVS